MNNILFTDTETTGFKKSGLIVEGQARVCQSAMIMTDEEGKVLSQFSCLVRPDGWQISDSAYNCHGISQLDCERYGLDQAYFMGVFMALASQCKLIVAHNKKFDEAMIDVEIAYYKGRVSDHEVLARQVPWYCTMEASKNVCKIPPTEKMKKSGRHDYKNPSLREALRILTGQSLENAHDAMADAMACKDVFFALEDRSMSNKNVEQSKGTCYNYGRSLRK